MMSHVVTEWGDGLQFRRPEFESPLGHEKSPREGNGWASGPDGLQ